ncbi:mitochondrial intermembrane space cysteine motif-containing protein Mix23p [[Candida] jaroonii]|uniref:Mitochondrial intermembrane space cysteine motif-containing protein Mix23p n=1 Tax=[Candida] jaroonii TaxID=467808 RepID=A0ACA9YCH3_9ASCO|nr:mitochondrial intermembrane space cysteine motif-containing protein Mix23p [[Candida] jaroonii]
MWISNSNSNGPVFSSSGESMPTDLITEGNCVESSRIRGFLSISRLSTDDSINTHLDGISNDNCDKYFKQVMLPQWDMRGKVISFCGDYAARLRKEIHEDKHEIPKFDLRLDPYALKAHQQKIDEKFQKVEAIENWVTNEQSVERIIHERSVTVLNQKCYYKDWYKQYLDSTKHL